MQIPTVSANLGPTARFNPLSISPEFCLSNDQEALFYRRFPQVSNLGFLTGLFLFLQALTCQVQQECLGWRRIKERRNNTHFYASMNLELLVCEVEQSCLCSHWNHSLIFTRGQLLSQELYEAVPSPKGQSLEVGERKKKMEVTFWLCLPGYFSVLAVFPGSWKHKEARKGCGPVCSCFFSAFL